MARMHACEMVKDFMTRTDGLYPFYRQAISDMNPEDIPQANSGGVGAIVRSEYRLWKYAGAVAMDESLLVLKEVHRRLN